MPSAVLKEIGGRKFSFAKLDAVNGIRLQLAIAKMAGAEVSMLVSLFVDLAKKIPKGSVKNSEALKNAVLASGALDEVGEILQRLAAKADPDEVIKLMSLVFTKVICDGRQVDIDVTFGTDSLTPWLVFVEGVKVNLGDFLAVVPSPSSEPPIPTESP